MATIHHNVPSDTIVGLLLPVRALVALPRIEALVRPIIASLQRQSGIAVRIEALAFSNALSPGPHVLFVARPIGSEPLE